MANPQHIEWLKEGVESWNWRRRNEPFVPVLDRIDFEALSLKNLRKNTQRGRFYFRRIDLTDAILRRSNLRNSDLWGADLRGADLRGANFENVDLLNAIFDRADVRQYSATSKQKETLRTNFDSAKFLKPTQLASMIGDWTTKLPVGMERPDHWEKEPNEKLEHGPPTVPPKLAGDQVSLVDQARFTLSTETYEAPAVGLSDVFIELQASLRDATDHLNLDNLSKSFHQALERFLSTLTDDFEDLPQIRFGISARTMTLRLDGEREHLKTIAPEKVGHLDAVVYLSNLLAARLPDFQEFLEQEQPIRATAENVADDMQNILSEAQVAIAAETVLFDESISERLSEYVNSMTIEGYLAAKNILLNIAQRTFFEVHRFFRDAVTTSRKIAVTLTATTVVTALGASLLKISKLFGSRLDWIDDWLTFLSMTFGL